MNAVIIGGCARSGTSLLLSLLSCHPRLYCYPVESQAFCARNYGASPAEESRARSQLENAVSKMERRANIQAWCEKTPKNVMHFSDLLGRFGREARLIHIVRDGRDVVTSIHPKNPRSCWVNPERWTSDVEAGLKHASHDQVLTIRYEDLIRDSSRVLRRLCGFIGLGYGPWFRSYPRTARVLTSDAWPHPALALHDRSIGRWTKSLWRHQAMKLEEDPVARQLLRRLGYSLAFSAAGRPDDLEIELCPNHTKVRSADLGISRPKPNRSNHLVYDRVESKFSYGLSHTANSQ
jgi:Sulfotransferase family